MAQLDVDGAAYLQHVCARLQHGPQFPAGRNLRDVHTKNQVLERYRLGDLVLACQYLAHIDIQQHGASTRIGVDPEDDYRCIDVHGPTCQLQCRTCHFCRQKTISRKAMCTQCGDFWCKSCLAGRHGEDRDEIGPDRRFPAWKCPRCRRICNCSRRDCVRRNNGWAATGQLVDEGVKDYGHPSVALYLMLPFMMRTDIAPDALDEAVARIHAEQAQVFSEHTPSLLPPRMPAHRPEKQAGAIKNALRPRPPLSLLERVRLELPPPASAAAIDKLAQLGFGVGMDADDGDEDVHQAACEFEAAFLGEPTPACPRTAAATPWWQRPPAVQAITPAVQAVTPDIAFAVPSSSHRHMGASTKPGHVSWARAQLMRAMEENSQGQRTPLIGTSAAEALPARRVQADGGQQQQQQQAHDFQQPRTVGSGLSTPDLTNGVPLPSSASHGAGINVLSVGHGIATHVLASDGRADGMRSDISAMPHSAGQLTSPDDMAEVSLQLFGQEVLNSNSGSGGGDEAQSAHKQRPLPPVTPSMPVAGAAPSAAVLPAEECQPLLGVVLRHGNISKAAAAGQTVVKGRTDSEWEFLHHPGSARPIDQAQQPAGLARAGAGQKTSAALREMERGRERDRAGGWSEPMVALHAPKRVRAAHAPPAGQVFDAENDLHVLYPPKESNRRDLHTIQPAAGQPAARHSEEMSMEGQLELHAKLPPQQPPRAVQDFTLLPAAAVPPIEDQQQGPVVSDNRSDSKQLSHGPEFPPQGALNVMSARGIGHVAPEVDAQEGHASPHQNGPLSWWTDELGEATSAGKGFFPGLLGVAKQAVHQAHERKAACGSGLQACQCAKCRTVEAHLQLVLREAVWAEVQHVQGSLPQALYINDEALPGMANGAHCFMRNRLELKCTAALLLLMVEKAEAAIARHAMLLFFNQEPFIDFQRCDPQARAALVRYGTRLLQALMGRQSQGDDVARTMLQSALEQFASWIQCVAAEHVLHMSIGTPLDPSKAAHAVDLGFMILPPPNATHDTVSCVHTRGSAVHGLQPRDARDDKVRSIVAATKALLILLLQYCQELVVPQDNHTVHPGLGSDVCLLLGSPGQASGLTALLDPRVTVAHEVQEMALKTVVLIISDANPRWPGADRGACSMAQLDQGRHVAKYLIAQLLRPLELLVSVKYPARRQLPALVAAPAYSQPSALQVMQAGLTDTEQHVMQLLPDAASKQQLEWAGMHHEVAERLKSIKHKLGHWPREVLGIAYGVLLWCGQLRWPCLLQLLLAPCTMPDSAAQLTKADASVCQFTVAMLAKVVSHLASSPPAHASVLMPVQDNCVLDPLPWSVLRVWAFSLSEPSCRKEAGSLSAAILDSAQAERLIRSAADVLNNTPHLQALLGPLPGAVQAPNAAQQDQLMDEEHPHLQGAYSFAQLCGIWDGVGKDVLGSQARAPALVILLTSADLSDAQWAEVLQDIGQVWCKMTGQQPTWSVSLTCTTLHVLLTLQFLKAAQRQALHAQRGLQPQLVPLVMSTPLKSCVEALLRQCCDAICKGIAQLDITGFICRANAGAAPSAAHNSMWLHKHLPGFHLASCFRAITQMAISNQTSLQASTAGSPMQLRVMLCQLLCIGILIPDPTQLHLPHNTLCHVRSSAQQQIPTARQSPSQLLLQHVVDALLSALFPVLPGSPATHCIPSTNTWAALQWSLCMLLRLLASVALEGSMREPDRERAAHAALRLTRTLLADARMKTITPLTWVLPPVLMTTMSALHLTVRPGPHGRSQLSCSSPALVRELYELWSQLLPALKQVDEHRSLAACLLPPSTCHSNGTAQTNWIMRQLDTGTTAQAVSLVLKAMCCHVLASAQQLRDGQAAGPLQDVAMHATPHAWAHHDKGIALLHMRQHAGLGSFLTSEADKAQLRSAASSIDPKLSLLFSGVQDAACQPCAADWYLQLLEVQLPFIQQLTTMQPDGSCYVWAAYILPELCSTLKQVRSLPPDVLAAYNRLVRAEQEQRQIAVQRRSQRLLLAAEGAAEVEVQAADLHVPPQSAWCMLALPDASTPVQLHAAAGAPHAPHIQIPARQPAQPAAGARLPAPHAPQPAQPAGSAQAAHAVAHNAAGAHMEPHAATVKQSISAAEPNSQPAVVVKEEHASDAQAASHDGPTLNSLARQPLRQLTAAQAQQLASAAGSCRTPPGASAAQQPMKQKLEILTIKQAKAKKSGDKFKVVALLHSIVEAPATGSAHVDSTQASSSGVQPGTRITLKLMHVSQPQRQGRWVAEYTHIELQGPELVKSLRQQLQTTQLYDWAAPVQLPSADSLAVVYLLGVTVIECEKSKRLVMPATKSALDRQRVLVNPQAPPNVSKAAQTMKQHAIAYGVQCITERNQGVMVGQLQQMEVETQVAVMVGQLQQMEVETQVAQTDAQMEAEQESPLAEQLSPQQPSQLMGPCTMHM